MSAETQGPRTVRLSADIPMRGAAGRAGRMRPADEAAPSAVPLVLIVEDDDDVGLALGDLFRSVGLASIRFGSTADLLASPMPERPSCLVLDVRLPGASGLDLQARLASLGTSLPIIFMTGFGDVPMSVRAMKAGAVDFLIKPFRDQDMLDAVAAGLDRDHARRRDLAATQELQGFASTLSPRERQIMGAVVTGLLNKQIAGNLGISEITVKLHRGNMMRKMKAGSVADLVRKVEALRRRESAAAS